jgi:hypothetical protein
MLHPKHLWSFQAEGVCFLVAVIRSSAHKQRRRTDGWVGCVCVTGRGFVRLDIWPDRWLGTALKILGTLTGVTVGIGSGLVLVISTKPATYAVASFSDRVPLRRRYLSRQLA